MSLGDGSRISTSVLGARHWGLSFLQCWLVWQERNLSLAVAVWLPPECRAGEVDGDSPLPSLPCLTSLVAFYDAVMTLVHRERAMDVSI